MMKPSTYTIELYKSESLVATDTVTITAGQRITKIIASKNKVRSVIWRIGEFDCKSFERKNGDKITGMRPSYVQMASWNRILRWGRRSVAL